MSLRRIFFFGLLLGVVWWMFRPAPPANWTGRAAPEPPRQTTTSLPGAWRSGEYTFTPLARFAAEAVVLSRRNYSGGHESTLCPTDFALGWGAMSDAAVLNAIRISQDMRWFFYEWRGELPVAPAEIAPSAANMHLIPANDEVRRTLQTVKRHDLLRFSGYLVEARHPDGWVWRSSTTRTDSGAGACEVVWVERADRAGIPAGAQ